MFILERMVPVERKVKREEKMRLLKKWRSWEAGETGVKWWGKGKGVILGCPLYCPFSLPSLQSSTGSYPLASLITQGCSPGKPSFLTPGRNLISYWNPEVLEALCATPKNDLESSSTFPHSVPSLIFPWNKGRHTKTGFLLFTEIFENYR